MPRIARIIGVGLPHHVTQRGNYQQNVFMDNTDRKRYLTWFEEYSSKYGLKIITYCLMTNHVHFIVIPETEHALAKTFNIAHMRYSQYFNKRMKKYGHLWQGRFYSCVLDEKHLMAAARYSERNPVRAGMVKKPWEWEWSSAVTHIGQRKNMFNSGELLRILNMSADVWKKYVELEDDEKFVSEFRKYSLTGRPMGDAEFTKNLENALKRKLVALPVGRPRKD